MWKFFCSDHELFATKRFNVYMYLYNIIINAIQYTINKKDIRKTVNLYYYLYPPSSVPTTVLCIKDVTVLISDGVDRFKSLFSFIYICKNFTTMYYIKIIQKLGM